MLLYAAQEDIVALWDSAWGDVPESAPLDDALLAASRRVRHATRAARYDVGTSGLPSDPDVVEAMRDATVVQCLLWLRNGISPDALQQPAQKVASKSMGGRSVTFAPDDPAITAARAQAAKELCDDAALILADAGLVGQPWAY